MQREREAKGDLPGSLVENRVVQCGSNHEEGCRWSGDGKYSSRKITAWSNEMKGHAEECVERYCELVEKALSSKQQVATLCIDVDHLISTEDFRANR